LGGAGVAFGASAENYKRGIRLRRRPRNAGCRQNVLEFSRANDGVHFRDVLADLIAESLDETSGDDQLLRLACGLVPGHFKDGVDRFLLGTLDERTGVDDDDVGIFGAAGQFGASAGEQAHHDLAVDKVLGAAEAHEANFLSAFGLLILSGRSTPGFIGSGDSKVLQRHAI
jgi:hypothetical protein